MWISLELQIVTWISWWAQITNRLLHSLAESGIGCFIGALFVGALVCADDIVLLFPTASGMRTRLYLCDVFANDLSVVFNAVKTNGLWFKGRQNSASYYKNPLAFWLAAMPLSLLAVGHTLVIYWLRMWMTRLILYIGSIHFVVKWMTYYVILVKGNLLSNYSWWRYTVLVFMAVYYGTLVFLRLVPSVLHGKWFTEGLWCSILYT